MSVIKNDGYGVIHVEGAWWFKTYSARDPRSGPYLNREFAMEALLASLGFDVADGPALSGKERADG